ncbi:MAG: ATP-dependent DNA helicase RecG [Planctomycetota bacterium]|jgi:ATP-dependent DNA helicase RecG
MYDQLNKEIEFLKGVGPVRAEILKKELGIFTWGDMLTHYPFRYVDKSQFFKINEVNEASQYIQLKGVITNFNITGVKRARRLVANFCDDTGSIDLVWFSKPDWMAKSLKTNVEYIAYGKPKQFGSRFNIAHPDIKLVSNNNMEGNALDPVYNSSEKMKKFSLDSKGISKILKALFEKLHAADLPESLPFDVLDEHNLMTRVKALKNIHFPKDEAILGEASFRIKFEELLLIQLRLLKRKVNRNIQYQGFLFEKIDDKFDKFFNKILPFELTGAQKRVLKEIRKDTLNGKQMNRLLQGDVGSGKTIVALMSMLMAIDNGFQASLIAPTEILAQQHFVSLTEMMDQIGVKCAFLSGSVKGKKRKQLLLDLVEGRIDILIGTHALLEDKVKFKNLGIVVIDEQHRFGVAQRSKMWKKNVRPPHILVMTATPIPRTLAMTLYGDLDVSVIDELPPGRKSIVTVHRKESARLRVFGFIKEEVEKGRQVYIVYPLIEESETLDYNHLMDGYESITRAFPEYAVSMVHGKMKPADKEYEMQQFVKHQSQIMVATTVIEVGVNVPNASVMIIESAERFGLSQLHQLRGRVGRGAEQSFCILITGYKISAESKQRMEIMVETNDGFRIAEVDLKMRGPGNIEGTQQSGITDLKLANLAKDSKILDIARQAAIKILQEDSLLNLEKNSSLKNTLRKSNAGWSMIS